MKKYSKLFLWMVSIWTILFTTSCTEKQNSSQELVMADSAYMQGHYLLGDAMLDAIMQQKKEIFGQDDLHNDYKLLRLEQSFLKGKLKSNDFMAGDSLCRFYSDNNVLDKYARALLFTGEICKLSGDYPTAMNYFLKAKDIVKQTRDGRMECLISRSIGDLYLQQNRFSECLPFYINYYHLARCNHDTLRMAYAATRMADVCIINQEIDSIEYYYKEAISLGQDLPQKEDIVPVAKSRLCDFFIQTEQFDKALMIMPRDSLNDANWAYWHYGQHNLDSAAYYFQKTLGRYKWAGEAETLRILAELEEQRGDLRASLGYYRRLAEAEDSLKVQQRAEETMRTEAQFNYTSIQQERDRLERRNTEQRHLLQLLIVLTVVVVLLALLVLLAYRKHRQKAQAVQERLEKEREEQALQSCLQQEENRRQLEALQQQLDEARRQDDAARAERLQMEAEVLATENENIEARQRRKEALLKELKQTPLYQRLKAPAKEGDHHMSEADWQELSTRLDEIYELGPRLLGLARLSETELRICYLLKLGVAPAEIADILCRSKSAITLARQRMLVKLTGRRGKADMLDELIVGFGV